MAVDEKYQGYGLGKKLALAVITEVKKIGNRKLFLETSNKLKPALSLYRSLGFVKVKMKSKSKYQRTTLRMELSL